jgi:hypothetical protein
LIREAVVAYFTNHFASPDWERPTLGGVEFPILTEVENSMLTAPFSLMEIEDVVRCSDGNKSPGPDGFNFAFVKAFWDLLKSEVRILFDQFHGNAIIPKSFLSYFVTLIPKVNSPFALEDFRPISLLGCLYKLVAKVLTDRLAKVMDSLISSNQSAFIKGRHLVDGVLVVNEVVDLAKKTGRECLILKVDFEKAYDSVDWGFLEYMLRRFGFCSKWISWIRACVFSGHLSVLVNGSPTSEINIQRGLKQGDPLAPFLFLLVAEGLSGIIHKAVSLNMYKGFSVGRAGLHISHLQYADDTLCIGEASVQNLWTLKAILRGFEMASGLKVNFGKSSLIGVNVSNDFMIMACTFLNCRRGTAPFNYLGLPVGANPRSLTTWEPLLAKLQKRLNSWGNKYISLGGRVVLLNSVLNAIPIFFLSFLKMPLQVWRKVVRIQREFLWGGVQGHNKINWIKWDQVCQEKRCGGLGVKDIRVTNLSLLAKWKWRLLQNERFLWKEVLVARYGNCILYKSDLEHEIFPVNSSRWWNDICAIDLAVESKKWFSDAVVRKLGNGDCTHFWLERWVGDRPLREQFPRLFSLSSQKEALVREIWCTDGDMGRWNLTWRRECFQWELELVIQLHQILATVVLNEDADSWVWTASEEDSFTVKTAYSSLATDLVNTDMFDADEKHVFEHIWCSPAPSKVVVFSWQLLHYRLPTRSNLAHRNCLPLDVSQACVMCNGFIETVNHLFLHCNVSFSVWYAVFNWLGVVTVMPPNMFVLFDCFWGAAVGVQRRKGYLLIWHAVVWVIWKARNNIIFNNGVMVAKDVVEEVKVISWRWSISRLLPTPCLLYEWCVEPNICLDSK